MTHKPNVLFGLPPGWDALGAELFANPAFNVFLPGGDYPADEIDYFAGFSPEPGFLKSLPRLKAIFSLGAGIDGFLRDPDFPRPVPLVRFVDPTLQHEMAQYVVLHVLMAHRQQRHFDDAQARRAWEQRLLPKPTRDTRIGILGLGDIGTVTAERLLSFDFQVLGWSRSRKQVAGVKSHAGRAEMPAFLSQCDMLACLLPLTPDTQGILNGALFAQLPRGAVVINAARGGHCNEADLIAALDSGQLSGAVLDVFETEPLPPESPLWRHPKITLTPHIAGITDPANAMAYVVDCVARAERGEALPNQVDVSRGY